MRLRTGLIAAAIGAVTVLAATVGAVVVFGDSDTAKSKPNIIYFLVDDMSTDLLPYMDNVNELADGGARFDSYFVSNSLCCTSRATMFTGMHPHNSGVLSNKGTDHGGYKYFEPLEDQTYAAAIKDTGDYRTAYLGKYINEYDMGRDYKVPEGWDEWHVADGGGYNEYEYKLSNYTGGDKKPLGDGGGRYLVDVMADRAEKFIDRSRDADESFFMQVSPFSPHSGVNKQAGKKEPRFPPAKRDRPGGEFPNGDCGPVDCEELDVTKLPGFDEDTKDKPDWVRKEPLSDKEIDMLNEDFRDRVRMVQSVDEMVGDVVASLTDAERDNTYVMFGADNGFHLGQHRLLRGKTTAYDTDTKTPFLVKRPESMDGGDVESDAIVQNVDMYATLVDIANGDADGPSDRDGRSMLNLINGGKETDWRTAAFVEHYKPSGDGKKDDKGKKKDKGVEAEPDPDADQLGREDGNNTPPSYAALRTADDLLVMYEGVSELEYYDLSDDADQLSNDPDDPRAEELTEPLETLAACGKDGTDCWEAAHVPAG